MGLLPRRNVENGLCRVPSRSENTQKVRRSPSESKLDVPIQMAFDLALPNLDKQCKAKAKSGERCKAPAMSGGICFFHANPDKASELGRIAGRSKGLRAAEPADPLPVLDSARAVRETVAKLITDVHVGKVHPKVAASLAPLLNLQLRAIETSKPGEKSCCNREMA